MDPVRLYPFEPLHHLRDQAIDHLRAVRQILEVIGLGALDDDLGDLWSRISRTTFQTVNGQLQAVIPDRVAEAPCDRFHVTLGVGSGSGDGQDGLFVHGSYEAIAAVRAWSDEIQRLRTERSRLNEMLQEDLGALLRALGMGDHARPQSPHEVMQEAIAEVGRLMRTRG